MAGFASIFTDPSIAGLPFALLTGTVFVLAIFATVSHCDRLIRIATILLAISLAPYAIAHLVIFSSQTAHHTVILSKLALGSIPLAGLSYAFFLWTMSSRTPILTLPYVFGALATVATSTVLWTTELGIDSITRTSTDSWIAHAGPLYELSWLTATLWCAVGIYYYRASHTDAGKHNIIATLVIGLPIMGALDVLYARQVTSYPYGSLCILAAAILGVTAIVKHNTLRTRGLDKVAVREALLVTGVTIGLAFLFTQLSSFGTALRAIVSVALATTALSGVFVLSRKWRQAALATDNDILTSATDEFVERAAHVRDAQQLAELASEAIKAQLEVVGCKLYWYYDGELHDILDSASSFALGEQTIAGFAANKCIQVDNAKVAEDDRASFTSIIHSSHANYLLTMRDRNEFIGAFTLDIPAKVRLSNYDKENLQQISQAAGRALTYLGLYRAAEKRVSLAKEIEVASAVQQARATRNTTRHLGQLTITNYYRPALQFGGHWWVTEMLSDQRVLVVIGDVTGHGVSAALVSSTVEGACETARKMYGASLDLIDLLHILNNEVLEVGQNRYAMSCFAAIFDTEANNVVFANAGHPFPYVCRHRDQDDVDLTSLVSRGTPLGIETPVFSAATHELQPNDLVVLYSESVVGSRVRDGQPMGERRFQRILKTRSRPHHKNVGPHIIDETVSYFRNELEDDLSLIVVEFAQSDR